MTVEHLEQRVLSRREVLGWGGCTMIMSTMLTSPILATPKQVKN